MLYGNPASRVEDFYRSEINNVSQAKLRCQEGGNKPQNHLLADSASREANYYRNKKAFLYPAQLKATLATDKQIPRQLLYQALESKRDKQGIYTARR